MSRTPSKETQALSSTTKENIIMANSAAKNHTTDTATSTSTSSFHMLSNEWTAYAHLPHDTDWTLASYKTLLKTNKLEEFIAFNEMLPDVVISKCMLFIMKNDVKPIWEDKHNKDGGCFSYKISNTNVPQIWRKISYQLIGNNLLLPNCQKKNNINGITISPKKNFCIIKIWLSDCSNKDPETINYFKGLSPYGCLFKKHLVH